MPKKVIKYTCDFKCRHTAMFLPAAIKHEKRCTLNPENKTCRTCSNEDYYAGGDYGEMYRLCKVSYINDRIGDIYDLLQTSGKHIKPLCKCPNYNIPHLVDEKMMDEYFSGVELRLKRRQVKPEKVTDDLPF